MDIFSDVSIFTLAAVALTVTILRCAPITCTTRGIHVDGEKGEDDDGNRVRTGVYPGAFLPAARLLACTSRGLHQAWRLRHAVLTDNFAAQSILASTAVALMDNLVDMPASRTGLC
jgi:hypothetical protein